MAALRRRFSLFSRREPLLSFVIGGGLLFFLLAPYLPSGKETIFIDARTLDGVVERRTNLEGRELTALEREQAIEDYVREETLLREAHRNGWHLQNGRVRRRLVLAMRTALGEDLPEPSTAQLRAYFQANADHYRVPESVTFSHVFFESGSARSSKVLTSLASGADFRAMGDAFWLGATMVRQTRYQLGGALGAPFAEKVFALEPGSWSGPIESQRGAHFVRVIERHPPELPELEAVARLVRVDWETERRADVHERKMSRIRERYTIIEP